MTVEYPLFSFSFRRFYLFSGSSMNFNRQLIELVKGCRLIYDASDALYGDAVQKELAWKEIAGKLNVHESECKKAWILLREGYRRAYKKQKAALRDPTNKKSNPITKWTYEDDLAFLAPHLKHRTQYVSYESIHIDREENPTDTVNQSNHEKVVQRKAKRSRTHESATRRTSANESYSNTVTCANKSYSNTVTCANESFSNTVTCANQTYSNTLVKYILDKTTKRDDIQHFFESISATVRLFPPRDRALAKAKVFQVISQMELEILSRECSSSLQYESSPVLCGVEVANPQNDLFITPPPEAPSSSLLEANQSTDDEVDIVLNSKIEPEETFIIKFEPDT